MCELLRLNLYLDNQPDALIIQMYCYKTLHVSGILSAHHQEFSTVHSALVKFHVGLHETYKCRMYSRELLMMGREDARNM